MGVLKCLQSLLQTSPVKAPRGLPSLGNKASKSPYVLNDPFERRQTFDVSQMGYGQKPNLLKIGDVNSQRSKDSGLHPSTMSKLKDLIEEYNEENGVTSPSQVIDRFDNTNNESNPTNNKGKYKVQGTDVEARSNAQDWMLRMRKIEGKTLTLVCDNDCYHMRRAPNRIERRIYLASLIIGMFSAPLCKI